MKRFAIHAAVLCALAVPLLASADIIPTIVTCNGADCTCADLGKVAQNIIDASIFIAVFLSAILFAWAGWKLLSGKSMGSHGAIQEGKDIFWNVVVGLVIIIASWLIIDTIMTTLTRNGAVQGVWNQICPKP